MTSDEAMINLNIMIDKWLAGEATTEEMEAAFAAVETLDE